MGNKISTSRRSRLLSTFSTKHSTSKRKKHLSPTPPPTTSSTTYSKSGSINSNHSVSDSIIRQGRAFHNVSESIYWLPNDDEEIDRLVGQHFALKTLFEGNVAKEILPTLENGAKILDVGCGPGTQIMDLATEFPDCELFGVDFCDVFPSDIRPPNVQFLHANVLERLPFDDNTFDFVNMRFFMLALRQEEWVIALKEIHRVLKPGGYFQSLEAGMMDRGNDFCLWVGDIFMNVMRERGQEPYIAFKIGSIMEECQIKHIKSDQRDTYLSKPDPLNREFLWDIVNIVRSAQPFLTGPLGVSPENFQQFLQKFEHECKQPPGAQWLIAVNVGQKPL
ncbi:S-adenosyl-L-methionine-dependent methyltransferase [Zychaea mexicana]|uniref:S-adenosyl-L-methionine-dependent methyltransferase n=1 Tax=Zychaea mexicana TaxID=64656 RepID=UPI0022FE1B61|nr:S-adenosyl-L-methionine-dependent methyltransferase [Zychaea mexicana]KAI9469332.1 S-adenosyl-L-methionine-dependent methyltransferase [Zychaea mexicana]